MVADDAVDVNVGFKQFVCSNESFYLYHGWRFNVL